MGSFIRQHSGAIAISVVLHLAVIAALSFGFRFPPVARSVPQQIAIQATVVDEALLQRELARIEELEREEIARLEQEAREAQQAADREAERLKELQREIDAAERLATLRREEERVAREEALRVARVEADREAARLVQEQREREEAERVAKQRAEEERKAREEAERLAKVAAEEARERQILEDELARELAAEDDRRQAVEAGLLDQYVRLIQNRIQQNWISPASARPGLECVVNVTQIPGGEVVNVRVGQCNGDDAVVRSIEAAVLRASPLPRPPVPALFDRNLVVTFRPEV